MAKPATQQAAPAQDEFAALLEENLQQIDNFEGNVRTGVITRLDNKHVIVDVGLKSEGIIEVSEFGARSKDLEVGSSVEVFVERFEDADGRVVLSREKARREEIWIELENAHEKAEHVNGVIFNKVKGGFTVDLDGAIAFLPGSQVDIRPIKDVSPLMGTPQPFIILKMDKQRGNIVVSRRAILEESRAEARKELLDDMQEGMVVEGLVKNITDYGAFIDLGGVDGLLHVTDISWQRINHPSEVLKVGQTLEVQIVKFNRDTNRISLGLKQLQSDPWDGVAARYPVNSRFSGVVTNIADYGAFVELEAGIEGLIHVSELSWTKKNVHPGKILSTTQNVEVMVLEVEEDKRRISLGLKQCQPNPWDDFANQFKVGDEIEGEVQSVTEFGVFIEMTGGIDGMVHLSDLSWDDSGEDAIKRYNKGDRVKAKVLEVDVQDERVALGIKQLTDDPYGEVMQDLQKGKVVTATVTQITDNGIEVEVREGVTGFVRRSDLSRDRSEQRPNRFAEGEKVDAMVVSVNRKNRHLALSIKQRELEEDKKAVAEYGSSDSGASLGDILGAALGKNS